MASRKKINEKKKIDSKEFFEAITQIAEAKQIDADFLFEQFNEAIIKAAKKADEVARKQYEAKKRQDFKKRKAERLKRYLAGEITEEEAYAEEDADQAALEAEAEKDPSENETVRCEINKEDRTIRIFRKYRIVEEIDGLYELTVDQIENYRPKNDKKVYGVGDILELEIEEPEILGRLFAMNVKGMIRQGISEEEKRRKTKEINDKDKEVVTAKVISVDESTGDAKIQIGINYFTLKRADQLADDKLVAGQDIKVYVYVSVEKRGEGSEDKVYANISRREPGMVKRLFEMEVPEISEGIVEIVSVSREAGSRTKIAVSSVNPEIDAVGACIGHKGQRVNVIIKELCGEKIDVIPYNADPVKYIASALLPAKTISVTVKESDDGQKNLCEVIVPNSQLSLAIGNKGQNVRLAAKLTGWKIDIKPENDIFNTVG